MMLGLVATVVMGNHSIESREMRELESIGRRRREERARSLFDMNAERVWQRRGTDFKADSSNLSNFKSLILKLSMILIPADYLLILRPNQYSKLQKLIGAAKVLLNAIQADLVIRNI
jgi:hypothetical protein